MRSLSCLGVVAVYLDGDFCRVRTTSSERYLAGVVTNLAKNGVDIKTLNTRRATLAQVFLKQIAIDEKSMRVEDEE